jgi:hypothetical protein
MFIAVLFFCPLLAFAYPFGCCMSLALCMLFGMPLSSCTIQAKIWCNPRVSINVLALLSGGGIRLASCLMLSTVELIRGWFSSLVSNISIWSCSHSYIRFRFARLSADIQLRLFGRCCISSVLSWLLFFVVRCTNPISIMI